MVSKTTAAGILIAIAAVGGAAVLAARARALTQKLVTVNLFVIPPVVTDIANQPPLPAVFQGIPSGGTGTWSYFQFDFGDGTTTGPTNLMAVNHTYTNPGSYTARFTAVDSAGNSGSKTFVVTVVFLP